MESALIHAEAPTFCEVTLDVGLFHEKNAVLKNRNMQGVRPRDKYERQINAAVYTFTPDEPTVRVRKEIADLLVANSMTWPLARTGKGQQVLEDDKRGQRVPLLKITKSWKADNIPSPTQVITLEQFKCPFTGQLFESEELFAAHLEEQAIKRGFVKPQSSEEEAPSAAAAKAKGSK